MKVFYAWHNVVHNKKRAAAAVAGIAFSILLVFMQLGFQDAARRGATLLYQNLDFDILLSSNKYENLDAAGELGMNRLVKARMVPGVGLVGPYYVGRAEWEDIDTEVESTLMLLACELDPRLVRDRLTASQLESLRPPNTVMLDTLSHRDFGPLVVGREGKINGAHVRVSCLFQLGMGFYRQGAALVSADTFQRLMRRDPDSVTFGLVKVSPGQDVQAVGQALRRELPSDVFVWQRQELMSKEQDYFLAVKPVGIMFKAGALISLVVGGVILFQVLSTEISNKLNEFATLKAMGYSSPRIYAVGIEQALIYAGLSYLIALLCAWGLLSLAHNLSKLPIYLTWGLATEVLLLVQGICALSGVLALQKVRGADPAELF